jgi:predicted permease
MRLAELLRYAVRQFKNSPGYFFIAVAALALGIGANTAIFSAVEAILLRPLPYGDPARLVAVWEDASFIGFAHNTPAPANFVDWRAQNQVFTDMAALRYRTTSLTGDQAPEQLLGGAVTANFFDVLQAQPFLGRPWTAAEDAAKCDCVVLSYHLWQRRFGSDPTIIGRSILLNGKSTTVHGVMPRDFYFPTREFDYWSGGYFTPEVLAKRDSHFLTVVARLKPGATPQTAQRDMSLVATHLAQQYPDSDTNIGAVVIPLHQEFAGDTRAGLWVLQIASVFVLLIACSNLANLLLARATGRRREIAVRLALGAGKKEIVGQLLAESLLLSATGGILGLALGVVCWRLLENYVPEQMAGATFALNPAVLFFSLGISMVSGVFFGLIPALKVSRFSIHDVLKEGGRTGESRQGLRLRDALVVAQFALALALLVGAGLMIQTMRNLNKMDLGFRSDHILTAAVPLPQSKYDTDPKIRSFYRDVLERLRGEPGIVSAGFASDAPFTADGDTDAYFVEGEPPLLPGQVNDGLYREVTAGYLQAIGARLVEGRLLQPSDVQGSQRVVVLNKTLADHHWPGQSALGKRIRVGDPDSPWPTVVGVVNDLREIGLLHNLKSGVYLPTEQVKRPGADYLVVRTAQEPALAASALREAVWAVDPQQPLMRIKTMDQLIASNLSDRQRPMILLGVFAALALLLACIGVYGVLAYAVTQRTREIGIRVAVGASTADVTRMILAKGLQLGVTGLVVGVGLALMLGQLLKSLLVGAKPASLSIYAVTSATLLAVAVLACIIPAARAARVDPVIALRDE